MKYLFVLFLFSFLSCSNTIQNNKMPSDFHFKIDNGANDRYHSNTGLFKRDYIEGTKTYEIIFNDDEKKSIYHLYKKIGFQSFPNVFEIIWNDTDNFSITVPSFETSIEMYENNSYKKVVLNFDNLRNPINDKDKALKYKELYDNIWQIIKSKEEYINIPKSDLFYL